MKSEAKTTEQYISELPEDRKVAIEKLRDISLKNLPNGFKEIISYGMLGYVVPHEIYPKGYHCTPQLPLPFFNIASQKNSINIYHMALYADSNLYNWFVEEYPKHSTAKLDMGKGCIRFKKIEAIPFELIGELLSKINPQQWVEMYENAFIKT